MDIGLVLGVLYWGIFLVDTFDHALVLHKMYKLASLATVLHSAVITLLSVPKAYTPRTHTGDDAFAVFAATGGCRLGICVASINAHVTRAFCVLV